MLTLKEAKFARDTLLAGVTTVRVPGGVKYVDLALRDAIKKGIIPGPTDHNRREEDLHHRWPELAVEPGS